MYSHLTSHAPLTPPLPQIELHAFFGLMNEFIRELEKAARDNIVQDKADAALAARNAKHAKKEAAAMGAVDEGGAPPSSKQLGENRQLSSDKGGSKDIFAAFSAFQSSDANDIVDQVRRRDSGHRRSTTTRDDEWA